MQDRTHMERLIWTYLLLRRLRLKLVLMSLANALRLRLKSVLMSTRSRPTATKKPLPKLTPSATNSQSTQVDFVVSIAPTLVGRQMFEVAKGGPDFSRKANV